MIAFPIACIVVFAVWWKSIALLENLPGFDPELWAAAVNSQDPEFKRLVARRLFWKHLVMLGLSLLALVGLAYFFPGRIEWVLGLGIVWCLFQLPVGFIGVAGIAVWAGIHYFA